MRKIHLVTAAIFALSQIKVNTTQILFQFQEELRNGRLDFTGLAIKYGHRPIRYEVITEDGYTLTLFRMPGTSAYPVLVVHGLMDTADTWLLRGEDSLGVTLANDGYDVWFCNSRGNKYSRGHVSLDPVKDATYWNWSFHEVGYYDLPAIIDKILNVTRATSVTAIGHSRGNQIFYILGSTRPEYNSKINLMIALAPICYFQNIQPPLTILFQILPVLGEVFNKLNIEGSQLLSYNSLPVRLLRVFCTLPIIGNEMCLKFITSPLFGEDREELGPSFVNVFIYHFPAGGSWKDLVHYAQQGNRQEFAQYDYGTAKNLQVYNTSVPPLYNLTQVTMPIALMAGRNDPLSRLPDVDLLRDQLPNVVDYVVNRRALLTHSDYVWGKHMPVYVFPELYRVLTRYNKV